MHRCVYAGSFDPITFGHLWMIEQGSRLFDELIVAIGINPEKRYMFSLDERLDVLKKVTAPFANVKVSSFENLYLVHYAHQVQADGRGLGLIEKITVHRLAHIRAQLLPRIPLREDVMRKAFCCEPAICFLRHTENNLHQRQW